MSEAWQRNNRPGCIYTDSLIYIYPSAATCMTVSYFIICLMEVVILVILQYFINALDNTCISKTSIANNFWVAVANPSTTIYSKIPVILFCSRENNSSSHITQLKPDTTELMMSAAWAPVRSYMWWW